MLRTPDFKLVVNPESVNELYDLRRDPHELTNVHEVPAYDQVRRDLSLRLYEALTARGDTVFTKWMAATTRFEVVLANTSKSDYDAVDAATDDAGAAVRG